MPLRPPRIRLLSLCARVASRGGAASRATPAGERLRRITSPRGVAKAVEVPVPAGCKRKVKRRPTALPALITFRNMRLQVPCTIADLSVAGAHLCLPTSDASLFSDAARLPDEIVLVMRTDGVEVPCAVRWRSGPRLGVRFLGPPRPVEPLKS